MALADIRSDLVTGLPHKTCGTCHALANMTEEDAAVLISLMADRRVKFTDLARALRDDPDSPTIGKDSLSRHANGNCAAGERLRK